MSYKVTFLGTYDKPFEQKEMAFDVELYKHQMVGVLEQFDKLCNEYHLRYSIAYGTMIGAIRHKGFIPWDDDIDVIMPRPDYDKFIALTMDGFSEGYEVMSAYNCKCYYLRWAKIIDANTTLVETFEQRNCPIGSFIDVFPIDGMTCDDRENDKRDNAVRKHLDIANTIGKNLLKDKMGKKQIVKHVLYKTLGRDRQEEIIKADKIASQIPFDDAPSAIFYGSTNKYLEAIPTSLFEQLIEIPFENITVKCFAKYDAYLTALYGDYMKLPPKEYQVSHHYHYFVDLHRRWTVEELKEMGII